MFSTNFLTKKEAEKLSVEYDTPLFVYSSDKLVGAAKAMLAVPAPYGITIRYAMKANPNTEILHVLQQTGVKIDASSGFEAEKAMANGFDAVDILLTSQQIPRNLRYLVEQGVQYNATSFHQLEWYGAMFPGSEVSIRINPGIGSGHSTKTNVGGPTSSFGIWHEYIPEVHKLAEKFSLKITRLHTHIGSGADPSVWKKAIRISLGIIGKFEDATTINLGGGFKVSRVDGEKAADMIEIGQALADSLKSFALESGRELHLELEPGTFLVANAGVLLAQVEDIVDTGPNGYSFIKLNTGMNDILRPSLYGAQHPIAILSDSEDTKKYIVVGHNCESGDLLTPAPGDPDALETRILPIPKHQDIVVIGGVGAYCASMAAHGYNSYPDAKEIMIL